MRIWPVPVLADNYVWIVANEGRGEAVLVDPGDAGPVAEALEVARLRPVAVLATHHHADHTAGIAELARRYPGLRVVAWEGERRIPAVTDPLGDGQTLELLSQTVECLHVPGHTRGAAAFHLRDLGAVMTGDTLFLAGCGRLFEGTAAEMHASLARLAALPPATLVYCGHEYTEKNLMFAASVDPDNATLRERRREVAAQRGRGEPTVPAPLALELATSPFLRSGDPALARSVGTPPGLPTFTELRRRRDRF